MSDIDYKAELDRHYSWVTSKLPEAAARWATRLRQPRAVFVRVPLAILLILGGIFSFLPVLGLWMLPLGLILLAQDVSVLQRPTALALMWGEKKWEAYQQRKRDKAKQNARES